ncbi:glycosyltransferase family 2 protein [Altericroceibacterium endophyticum]|uniref:Glycosyltransferase n=1 Tax=Altericroceibacterium endophyticum TaxID=1808508 RepID=A0A6I4T7V6_9SPHN|nr:glycosyltransferase family A protein [Altericroceibacterium endophyticum]MXO66342.1 glycosyltransferase [Altericroceibacterium endophyticum]
MTQPLFSIIMPAYNAEKTIEAAIYSALEQSEDDFELIVIDDGSQDSTLRKALHLAVDDRRIHVVSRENAGVSEARNLGVEMARGLFIAFLDADDQWYPNKLAAHRHFHAANPNVAASFGQIAFREDRRGTLQPAKTLSSVPQGPLSLMQILSENPVCTTSNLVVSAAAFHTTGPFEAGLNHAEDQEWLARLICHGFALCGIDELLVDYRMSDDGLSADLDAMLNGWRSLVERYAGSRDMSGAEAIYCRYLARRALRTGAPVSSAYRFARQGLNRNATAFFNDMRRGWMTLLGVALSPAIPRNLRPHLFA